ncbi:MAG: putative tRNA nucleotidyltransferase [Ilumatobacteraceae bacterium]|nr:putative tRNA nucleotidyltransferase [Ilumatobacteraceae bacterium]
MIAHRFAPVLRELQPLSDRFAAAGHRLFLVGGTVRDLMVPETLGPAMVDPAMFDRPADFDIDATTTARPDEIKRCLQGWADAIWTQGERFGTIGAMKRVPGPVGSDLIERTYEITTHRAEAYQGHSRKPDVEFSMDIQSDLSRRDFTVNAMAIELTASVLDAEPDIIDPFGGVHDLRDRVLRTPLSPEASFSDDPLRMLRAARFIARYRLQPDAAMLRAVRALGDRMQIVSAERIRDELDKLLMASLPGEGLRFVADTGLLQHVVPELVAAVSQPDEPCHAHLWAHTVQLVDAVPATQSTGSDRRLARLAALLHPLGVHKATTRLRALRASNDDTRDVATLIGMLDSVLARFAADSAPWTDGDVRRYVRDVGALRPELRALLHAEVAVHAESLAQRFAQQSDALEAHIVRLSAMESLDDLGPQLDGAAVMAQLGLTPGPAVGRVMGFLTELRIEAGLLSDGELRRCLEEWWSDHEVQ